MLFGVILTITILLSGRVENVRLCGKQLADLLNNICERNGGFHTPSQESSASLMKRTVIEILRPRSRRTGTGETNSDTEAESSDDEVDFTFHSGIVDECCKKPCTFATLVSYCANAQQSGNIEIQGVHSSGIEDGRDETDGNLPESEIQQISSDTSSSDSNSDDEDHLQRPNLGHSDRNRPVFIVLSQTTDD